MRSRGWMVVVLGAFATGWIGGRQSSPSSAGESGESPARLTSAAAASRTDRDAARQQWGAKLDERTQPEMAAMAKEIPGKDLGPAIEAWFDSYGIGGLDHETVNKAWKLIDAWVAEDFDSAWAWANSVQQPATREFVIKAIAGSMAEKDPQRAFECLVSNGDFRSSLNDQRLMTLVTKLSDGSLEQGPDAFVAFWKRIPLAKESVNSFMGVTVKPGPGTDFLGLQGAIDRELGNGMDRPINPSGVMEAWTKADPQGALDYLLGRVGEGQNIRDQWSEVRGVITKEKGSAAADQWTLDLLREMPEGDRGAFLVAADFQNYPNSFLDMLRSGATDEESAAIYRETLQAGVDQGRSWGISTLLSSLPMEERIRHLKELRGPQAFQAVKDSTSSWKLTEGQLEEIKQAIERE
jgi:hypothetical protein